MTNGIEPTPAKPAPLGLLAGLGIAWLSFVIGGRLGPLISPYKLYASDDFTQVALLRARSLLDYTTYLYDLDSYVGFLIIYLLCHFLFRTINKYLSVAYFIILGAYYDVMWNGTRASYLKEDILDALHGYIPNVIQSVMSLLIPFTLMLLIPLLVGYALSRIGTPRSGGRPASL